jgi:hypothetical protein
MQVAHKEGHKGSYNTVKDNQVCGLMYFWAFCSHLWMVLHSLLDCIRHADWGLSLNGLSSMSSYWRPDRTYERWLKWKENGESIHFMSHCLGLDSPPRLLEYAPLYFDLKTFANGEAKKALQRVRVAPAKRLGHRPLKRWDLHTYPCLGYVP